MGKKASLKSALLSQQSRLKKTQEAAHAAQVAEKGKRSGSAAVKGKGKQSVVLVNTNNTGAFRHISPAVIPFKATDIILLVGEGDFSFTQALVMDPPTSLQYLPPGNITATAYDSEEECYRKYPGAQDVVQKLRERNVKVVFSLDATKLEKHSVLKHRTFDKVMWNFPHAGKGITDQDRNIFSNQLLLLGFLRSAAHVLKTGPMPALHAGRKKKSGEDSDDDRDKSMDEEDKTSDVQCRGTVLITLRNVPPYTLWDLSKLAKNPPPPTGGAPPHPRYVQLRSFKFDRSMWKGYEHRMTKGERAYGKGTTGIGGEDRTWEFYLRD